MTRIRNAGDLDRFCDFARRFLTTERGRPLVIEEFQKKILADYFGGARETVVVVGKKNGKSSLLGAVALFHVLNTPEAECVIVAASRDQAGIMLRQIQGYVRRSEALRARLRVVQREVRDETSGGRIRVLASDSDTLDGQIPTLALVDELARTKTEEAYGLLRDGLGPRNGQMVAISTAGDDEESPLGRLRSKAHSMEGFTKDGAYQHVRQNGFAWHEWSLPAGADITDLKLLKSACPASWIDEAELRARRDSPSTQPWQLARFTAGQWVAGSEESAISQKEWQACADLEAEIPEGASGVFIGVDLGWKWDTTAYVPVWRRSGVAERQSVWNTRRLPGEFVPEEEAESEEEPDPTITIGEPAILTPPQDGTSLDAEDVFAVAEFYVKHFDRPRFVLDPEAGGEQLGQRIERKLGVEVITHSQKTGPMCGASQRLAEMISAGKIRHPGHPELDAHILAATVKWVGPMWRLVKPKGKKLPIDAAVAAAMAVEALATQPPGTRVLGWL